MNDPYTTTLRCVNRLYKEYKRHPRIIVACDFDDTVSPYHDKSETHQRVFSVLRECQKHNFYIVLWTASAPERFDFMKNFMNENGIKIDSINENPIPLPFGNNGKIYYNILLDDRAGLGSALDTLETLLFLIDKSGVQCDSEAQKKSSTCNKVRIENGESYPRTCVQCGLGPCKEQNKTI